MEFHTLTRRELQALCKKNKIPANITNAAMAEALKALKIVEGIEEFMQSSQSETVQSSIESLEGSEVTSPYVHPTAGRSTRRRNILKEDLEDVTSVNTTRRTTRKTAAKASHESQAGAIETPALVSQTRGRKAQMASACRKMDSQLKECMEKEEKRDVSMTPAPLGVTSRRMKVEGTVQKAYSTRRSVRLAEKNEEMLNDDKAAETELFNNEILTKDDEIQEENHENNNELLGITDVDAIANMEENHENKEKSEVVSAEEVDAIHEEESCMESSAESQLGKEISDNIEFTGGEESVKPGNVSDDGMLWTSEIETNAAVDSKELDIEADVAGDSVEKKEESEVVSAEEVDTTHEEESSIKFSSESGGEESVKPVEQDIETDVAGDFDELVPLQSEDKFAEKEDEAEQKFQDDKETDLEEEVQNLDVTLAKLTELRLQQEDDIEEVDSDFTNQKSEPDEMEALGLEENEKAMASEVVVPPPTKVADDIEEAADEEQAEEASETMKEAAAVEMGVALAEQIPIVQPNKYAAMILSDNKENMGTKLVIMKEAIKPAAAKDSCENLNEFSVRKLTKMLKEKLEITKKSSNEALPRAALQVLPENQGKN